MDVGVRVYTCAWVRLHAGAGAGACWCAWMYCCCCCTSFDRGFDLHAAFVRVTSSEMAHVSIKLNRTRKKVRWCTHAHVYTLTITLTITLTLTHPKDNSAVSSSFKESGSSSYMCCHLGYMSSAFALGLCCFPRQLVKQVVVLVTYSRHHGLRNHKITGSGGTGKRGQRGQSKEQGGGGGECECHKTTQYTHAERSERERERERERKREKERESTAQCARVCDRETRTISSCCVSDSCTVDVGAFRRRRVCLAATASPPPSSSLPSHEAVLPLPLPLPLPFVTLLATSAATLDRRVSARFMLLAVP